jgi:hypothetical protein
MPFSISPTEIFKLLEARVTGRKSTVADYLDGVATEATALAQIWERAAKAVLVGNAQDYPPEQRRHDIFAATSLSANSPRLYRLQEFYRTLTIAIGGKISPELQTDLMDHLARILLQRELTRKSLEDAVPLLANARFFDTQNTPREIQTLLDSVEALHREAAALDVLAKTYRVQNT